MNIMPWEPYEYEDIYLSYSYRFKSRRRREGRISAEFSRKFQQLPDNKLLQYRKGDIIQFENGHYSYGKDWKDWFLSEKDYIKHLKNLPVGHRNKKVPLYAANQYAVVIGRYRIIKNKYAIYYDYGTVVMMLTGDIGRVRKYYVCTPFRIISKFPHKKVIDELKLLSNIILSCNKDSDECRNLFVSTLYKKYH